VRGRPSFPGKCVPIVYQAATKSHPEAVVYSLPISRKHGQNRQNRGRFERLPNSVPLPGHPAACTSTGVHGQASCPVCGCLMFKDEARRRRTDTGPNGHRPGHGQPGRIQNEMTTPPGGAVKFTSGSPSGKDRHDRPSPGLRPIVPDTLTTPTELPDQEPTFLD
jgi:hypothetical protein